MMFWLLNLFHKRVNKNKWKQKEEAAPGKQILQTLMHFQSFISALDSTPMYQNWQKKKRTSEIQKKANLKTNVST